MIIKAGGGQKYAGCFFLFCVIFFVFIQCKATFSQTVDITPLPIQEALSYFGAPNQPLETNVYFQKQREMAKKAGVNLEQHINKNYVAQAGNNNIYFLFYNLACAYQCKKNYLIQKVRLEKTYFKNSKRVAQESEYLVEVLKLNQFKQTKKPDEHVKRYALGNYDARELILTVEIGCGEIPGVVQGNAWPYDSKVLYHCLQDYAGSPGYYDMVQFQFSSKYRMEVYFSRDNEFRFVLPDFLK